MWCCCATCLACPGMSGRHSSDNGPIMSVRPNGGRSRCSVASRTWCMIYPHQVSDTRGTGQDGGMRDTRIAAADGMRAAIERSGYYPGLVFDAVSSALGAEP